MKATMYHRGAEERRIGNQQPRGVRESHVLLAAYWIKCTLALAAVAALCSGCSIAGANSIKNFSLSEEVKLDDTPGNVMAVVEDVGKSLGYRVSGRMNKADLTSLTFSRDASMMATMVTGYMRTATITVVHNPKEQKLDLTMMVMGSFGAGSEDDVQKALQAFKAKLQERLGAQQ